MYTSKQIANYFIRKSHDTGVELTPMKLIKLCYIAHGWHLAIYDEPLLDEVVYAWKYGPVIESIYHDFKKYGKGQISELWRDDATQTYPLPTDDKKVFFDKIWEVYGGYTGINLSALTHQKKTPWDIVWNDNGGCNRESAIISNDLIKQYYKDKATSK